MKSTVRTRLEIHLANGGTPNDSETDSLFREAFHISPSDETVLEEVEQWAVYGIAPLVRD